MMFEFGRDDSCEVGENDGTVDRRATLIHDAALRLQPARKAHEKSCPRPARRRREQPVPAPRVTERLCHQGYIFFPGGDEKLELSFAPGGCRQGRAALLAQESAQCCGRPAGAEGHTHPGPLQGAAGFVRDAP
jgi:hypothetical protein